MTTIEYPDFEEERDREVIEVVFHTCIKYTCVFTFFQIFANAFIVQIIVPALHQTPDQIYRLTNFLMKTGYNVANLQEIAPQPFIRTSPNS